MSVDQKKANRENVRRFRERLKKAGLVRHEVHILPEHIEKLKKAEKKWQKP